MNMFNKNIYYILFVLCGLIYAQDPPLGFEYNQGTEQGFYFFQNITIDGQPLDDDDWIGAFKPNPSLSSSIQYSSK